MTDEILAYAVAKMKEHGIGAMTDARMKDFFDKMVKAGLFKPELDYTQAFTLQFVNKGVGLELKK